MSDQAKANILHKIKQALQKPVPVPFPVSGEEQALYEPASDDLAIVFAQQFSLLQGQFAYCMSGAEMMQQLKHLQTARGISKWYSTDEAIKNLLMKNGWQQPWHNNLADCHASITSCEVLVARTGSMVLSSTASGGRTTSVYAPIHICIATTQQLVYDLQDAFDFLEKKYGSNLPSQISFASGPSRTADIEKTLVTGVHGPKEVFCFLLENQ